MTDPRLARPLWRGRTNVDALTISCIEKAERIGGHEFVVTQGSYQSTVTASAGTHDRGGAVDLRWCGHGYCILALRQAGMAATWHRKELWRNGERIWPDHIHAVVYGHPDLAPAAARQVESVLAGRNGLADNGPDDGPRLSPFTKAAWPPTEEDDMFSDEDRTMLSVISTRLAETEAKVDDLAKAEKRRADNQWRREAAMAKKLKELGVDVDQVLAEVVDP